MSEICPDCSGTGKGFGDNFHCRECGGSGFIELNNEEDRAMTTERWHNVFRDGIIYGFYQSRQQADNSVGESNKSRTHYLKTYLNEDGVICTDPGPELIPIDND